MRLRYDDSVEEFRSELLEWLAANRPSPEEMAAEPSVSTGHAPDWARRWTRTMFDAGWLVPGWPPERGGRNAGPIESLVFIEELAKARVPRTTNVQGLGIVAPSIFDYGTDDQVRDYALPILRGEVTACLGMSEPGAGSDLASLSTRAVRDGDEWVINGQKVWSSGARFAEWGELIARSDPEVPKHRGLTAFIIPMDLPGIEVRRIKQMSGGASFNEVFFNDVRVPDSMRLGDIGDGWRVALTTLGFERDRSGESQAGRVGGSWAQLLATARAMGVTDDPVLRQRLAEAYTHQRVETLLLRRLADLVEAGATPGPEGSLGKLQWTNGMALYSDVVSQILGPALVADSGAWGTFGWGEHVLGAPGYRIAGGSDEIQRNIIGERVLGLPPEPRVDKDVPWRDVLR